MARARTHTLTVKHLAVLQWFERCSVTPERPDGWCSEKRVQHDIRIDGKRIAIGEEFHDLTIKLNERDEPFLIVHPSGKHYRISDIGRRLARKCSVAERQTERGPVKIVIETKTGRPPIIRSTEYVPTVTEEDDDDIIEAAPPTTSAADAAAPDADPPYQEPAEVEETDDEQPAESGHDEINDPQPIRAKTTPPTISMRAIDTRDAQTRPTHAPPKPKPSAAKAPLPRSMPSKPMTIAAPKPPPAKKPKPAAAAN